MAEYRLPSSCSSHTLNTNTRSDVDLTSLISTLDTAASDLVTHQRDTLVQRKELAQKTKDFRKLEDAAKLGEIKGLLKSYQSFIDLISNQSKSTQSAFLQIYSPLSEAPDPYPLLEASIDSFVTAQEVVPKLESENKHLQSTVAKLTAQLEETESQLEQERSARQSSQSTQDTKIKEVEASWKAVLKEKQDNWDAREKSLEEKVENQDRLLKELKASYDVAQRLGKAEDDTSDSIHGASQQELDLVNQELEKANLRLSELEGRNEQLRFELAQSTANQSASQTAISVEDDPAFLRLRSENSQLLRKLDAQRYEKDSEKTKWDSSVRSLERELESLKQDRESIKRKLDKCSDYDEVKQELDMLKVGYTSPIREEPWLTRSSRSSSRQATQMIPTTNQTLLLLLVRASHWRSFSSLATRSSPTSSPFSVSRTMTFNLASSRCKKSCPTQSWSWRSCVI